MDLISDYSSLYIEAKKNKSDANDPLLEDILIKTVRVFANLSVRAETGEEMACLLG